MARRENGGGLDFKMEFRIAPDLVKRECASILAGDASEEFAPAETSTFSAFLAIPAIFTPTETVSLLSLAEKTFLSEIRNTSTVTRILRTHDALSISASQQTSSYAVHLIYGKAFRRNG